MKGHHNELVSGLSWEDTGHDEMNQLYKRIEKTPIELVDQLETVVNMLEICEDALSNSQLTNVKQKVASVIHFTVNEQIEKIKQELEHL